MNDDDSIARGALPAPGVYLVASRPLVAGRDYLAVVAAALRGGVGMVQMREKGLEHGDLVRLGHALRRLTREHRVPLIVNDDPSVAVEVDADGVHVGQDDASVAVSRAIVGEGRWIGLSTHTREQVRAAADTADVDMIGVGPVFGTSTKDAGPAVGIPLVEYAARVFDRGPVYPIGGIDETNAALVRGAGGRGVAVSSAILTAADPEAAARRLAAALA